MIRNHIVPPLCVIDILVDLRSLPALSPGIIRSTDFPKLSHPSVVHIPYYSGAKGSQSLPKGDCLRSLPSMSEYGSYDSQTI